MIWVALLRGINVGGKNLVSMKSLKERFERLGFEDVRTYIASGNVLFRSAETDPRALEETIDRMLPRAYGVKARTVVRSHPEMRRLVKTIDKTWDDDPSWRHDVVFLRHSIDSKRLLDELGAKPDIERVVYCPGTLLWSARVDAVARSAFVRLPGKAVYQEMTVRTVNTTRKLFELMESMDA